MFLSSLHQANVLKLTKTAGYFNTSGVSFFCKFERYKGMRKSIYIIFVFYLMLGGCKKSNDVIPTGTSVNYSDLSSTPSNTGGVFSFTKITTTPGTIKQGAASKVIATATGSNLTYTWSTSHGELFGSGSAIYYSDSCIGTYTITCVVSDGTHTATITVPITVSG